jgi:hypothetical protein
MIIKDQKHLKSLANYANMLWENQLETYEAEGEETLETNNRRDSLEAFNFLKNFPTENIGKEFKPSSLPNFAGDFLIMALEEHEEHGDFSEQFE